eukprot:403362815
MDQQRSRILNQSQRSQRSDQSFNEESKLGSNQIFQNQQIITEQNAAKVQSFNDVSGIQQNDNQPNDDFSMLLDAKDFIQESNSQMNNQRLSRKHSERMIDEEDKEKLFGQDIDFNVDESVNLQLRQKIQKERMESIDVVASSDYQVQTSILIATGVQCINDNPSHPQLTDEIIRNINAINCNNQTMFSEIIDPVPENVQIKCSQDFPLLESIYTNGSQFIEASQQQLDNLSPVEEEIKKEQSNPDQESNNQLLQNQAPRFSEEERESLNRDEAAASTYQRNFTVSKEMESNQLQEEQSKHNIKPLLEQMQQTSQHEVKEAPSILADSTQALVNNEMQQVSQSIKQSLIVSEDSVISINDSSNSSYVSSQCHWEKVPNNQDIRQIASHQFQQQNQFGQDVANSAETIILRMSDQDSQKISYQENHSIQLSTDGIHCVNSSRMTNPLSERTNPKNAAYRFSRLSNSYQRSSASRILIESNEEKRRNNLYNIKEEIQEVPGQRNLYPIDQEESLQEMTMKSKDIISDKISNQDESVRYQNFFDRLEQQEEIKDYNQVDFSKKYQTQEARYKVYVNDPGRTDYQNDCLIQQEQIINKKLSDNFFGDCVDSFDNDAHVMESRTNRYSMPVKTQNSLNQENQRYNRDAQNQHNIEETKGSLCSQNVEKDKQGQNWRGLLINATDQSYSTRYINNDSNLHQNDSKSQNTQFKNTPKINQRYNFKEDQGNFMNKNNQKLQKGSQEMLTSTDQTLLNQMQNDNIHQLYDQTDFDQENFSLQQNQENIFSFGDTQANPLNKDLQKTISANNTKQVDDDNSFEMFQQQQSNAYSTTSINDDTCKYQVIGRSVFRTNQGNFTEKILIKNTGQNAWPQNAQLFKESVIQGIKSESSCILNEVVEPGKLVEILIKYKDSNLNQDQITDSSFRIQDSETKQYFENTQDDIVREDDEDCMNNLDVFPLQMPNGVPPQRRNKYDVLIQSACIQTDMFVQIDQQPAHPQSCKENPMPTIFNEQNSNSIQKIPQTVQNHNYTEVGKHNLFDLQNSSSCSVSDNLQKDISQDLISDSQKSIVSQDLKYKTDFQVQELHRNFIEEEKSSFDDDKNYIRIDKNHNIYSQ